MRRALMSLVVVVLIATFAYTQQKVVTGTVVDHWVNNSGTSESITVQIDGERYEVFLTRPDLAQPRIVGRVRQVGKVVRISYTKLSGNELRATRIVEVRKARR